jgi:hypothetical protein
VLRTRFDRLAKGILEAALAPVGEVRTQEEIHGEVQAADVLFRPTAPRADVAHLGLLGRIASTSCLIEPFHATPGSEAVLDCVDKHLTLRRNRMREARKAGHGPDLPALWLLSTGRPRSVLTGLRFAPLRGWPPGVWRGPPLLSLYLVVLRDLPETRATLPLRLLGAGPAFLRVARELPDLPHDAWEPRAFVEQLIAYTDEVAQNPDSASEDDMSTAEELKSIYKDWEQRVRNEGMEKGIEQGMEKGMEKAMREALVSSYQARFGEVPAALRAAVDATSDIAILRGWLPLFTTAAVEDIAAAVRPRARKRTRTASTDGAASTAGGSRARSKKPARR